MKRSLAVAFVLIWIVGCAALIAHKAVSHWAQAVTVAVGR